MILESLLVILIVVAFLVIVYKGAVHEFQILQKEWAPNIDWSPLLNEALPLVIRNVPQDWTGSTWTRQATEQKTWPIRVEKEGKVFGSTWTRWITSPPGQPAVTNMSEIVAVVSVPVSAWVDGGFRRWSWLPADMTKVTVGVLGPDNDSVLSVRRTTASATVLQSTDGAPLHVWLAHEGSVPKSVNIEGRNPWTLTAEEFPWISEVKYVEIKVRPGNALVIPTHWWFSARPQLPIVSSDPTMGDGSWYWLAEFHTPISWLVSRISN